MPIQTTKKKAILLAIAGAFAISGIAVPFMQNASAAAAKNEPQPKSSGGFRRPIGGKNQVAAQRLAAARAPDRFEAEPQAFFQRVAQGYAERAALAPQRFVRIDGAQPLAQVQQQVFAALRQRGWLEEAAP